MVRAGAGSAGAGRGDQGEAGHASTAPAAVGGLDADDTGRPALRYEPP